MVDLTKLFKDAFKMEPITKGSVEKARTLETKRICFSVNQKQALKRSSNPPYVGVINVPFGAGFKRIFPFTLFSNPNDKFHADAYWKSISSEEEYQEIEAWIKQQGDRVFLRDCLSASIALSCNFKDVHDGEKTEIGELEYQAKRHQDMNAVEALADRCASTIMDIELYRDADMICAIPPQAGKEFDLPSLVASRVSAKIGKVDITNKFKFGAEKKKSAKFITLDERWANWDAVQLTLEGVDIAGKKIILIDDKYQSGTTIQYVAMKLQQAGAHQVYGLSMVKTMRDTDNQ